MSSDPKVGSSAGLVAGYLRRFDEQSPTSTFGVTGTYSDTDSYVAGLFGQAYFGADRHRLSLVVATGKIRNDYEDFLGTGLPLQVTDDLRFAMARYLRRVSNGWFVGLQLVATNYLISGDDWFSQQVLDTLGLTGFDSNGLGLVAQYDTRDNQNSPTRGSRLVFQNLAYRESLGGDEDFDTYGVRYQQYRSHGAGHVLAWRALARITDDAPPGAYSSIPTRGYVLGGYLAKHMIALEMEERFRLTPRWALAGFTGATCLLNDLGDCDARENWYPMLGAGVIFTLKPRERIVVRMDYAVGKSGNQGFYMSFGHPF
ncbi:MAG: hypothetical protein R3E86_14665 [Pseudomonadales bacterium]